MNSGLYALAGASATATAAAWANLLLEPMTKVSKVYLELSLAGGRESCRAAGWPKGGVGSGRGGKSARGAGSWRAGDGVLSGPVRNWAARDSNVGAGAAW